MQADILCAAEIEKYLTKARKGNITVFDTVDSTNTVLKNLCAEGKARPGDCVTADCQTKGAAGAAGASNPKRESEFTSRFCSERAVRPPRR